VFPIIWLLGAFDLVSPDIELYAYLTIDVSVKVVFSVFLRQVTLSSIEHREVQEYEKFKVCPPLLYPFALRTAFPTTIIASAPSASGDIIPHLLIYILYIKEVSKLEFIRATAIALGLQVPTTSNCGVRRSIVLQILERMASVLRLIPQNWDLF
jgi:hypothetical protein